MDPGYSIARLGVAPVAALAYPRVTPCTDDNSPRCPIPPADVPAVPCTRTRAERFKEQSVPISLRAALKLLVLAIGLAAVGRGAIAPATAQTISLKTADSAALMAALAGAKGGETILLPKGDYGALTLNATSPFPVQFSAPVTITSADPAHPARFSKLALNKVRNLHFDNVLFKYTFKPADKPYTQDFLIMQSRDIAIRGSWFEGDVARGVGPEADGYGFAYGLGIRVSSGIVIEDCTFHTFAGAMQINQSENVTLRGNEIYGLRVDGMQFAAVQSVLVEGNYIHDFRISPKVNDHPDMIQFWTSGTKVPSRNITIRGNVFNSGHGLYTQSIFMRNELVDQKQAEREMYYRNVLIEENVIINAHLHGITLGEADGVMIRNNTLIHNRLSDGPTENPPLWRPRINVSPLADNVTITGNITAGIEGGKARPDWVVRDNLIVQDSSRLGPGFYDKVFTAARTGDPATLAPFTYLDSGPADGRKFGARMLRPDKIVATMRGLPGASRSPSQRTNPSP